MAYNNRMALIYSVGIRNIKQESTQWFLQDLANFITAEKKQHHDITRQSPSCEKCMQYCNM